jgi:hypothetical protein
MKGVLFVRPGILRDMRLAHIEGQKASFLFEGAAAML